jgi:hypothetical protein
LEIKFFPDERVSAFNYKNTSALVVHARNDLTRLQTRRVSLSDMSFGTGTFYRLNVRKYKK